MKKLIIINEYKLGSIRINQNPSFEDVDKALLRTKESLDHLHTSTKLDKNIIGLGFMDLNLHANVGKATGYMIMNSDRVVLNLSADNGWQAFGHEWFHGLDYKVGQMISPNNLGSFDMAETPGVMEKAKTLSTHNGFGRGPLLQCANELMCAIRSNDANTNQFALLTIEEQNNRIMNGLYDRFYASRVLNDTDNARISFSKIVQGALTNSTPEDTIKNLSSWREHNLGINASMNAHYDSFIESFLLTS